MTRAATTRCTMNWYECNWSCRDGMRGLLLRGARAIGCGGWLPRLRREATASTARAADPRPVRPGQVAAAQVAVALPIAATGHGPLMMAAAVIAGAALIALAWVRMRRRWLFEWAALGVRYRARSHALPAGASAAELLRLVAPDSTVDEAGVVSDRHGLTAILELGDSTLLRDGWTAPSAADARHAPGADGRPAPTAGDGSTRTERGSRTTRGHRCRRPARVARPVDPAAAGRPGAPADPRTAAARRIARPRTADRWRAACHVLPAAERRTSARL